MRIKKICVLGGSGFVGSALVSKLDAAGYAVTVLTRKREAAKHLILLPHVNVVECNVFDHQALRSALEGSDAVINLIGILHQRKSFDFETMHHQLPDQLAKACVDLGIRRLLHMSSLRADKDAPSQYLRSKAAGENALLSYADKLDITIFKPSVIFGRGDSFTNLFAKLIRYSPVILLAKPDAQFQPIWVEDVVSCFVNSVENKLTHGNVYELGGPKVYSFRTLLKKIMHTIGVQRPIVGLSDGFSYLQAFVMEWLPVKVLSRDNIRSMEVDSVTQQPLAVALGIEPAAMEAVMPEYLIDKTSRGAYDHFRSMAAR